MVEEMLAARGIAVTHETIRQWGLKFGQEFAKRHCHTNSGLAISDW
jgi:putative transposase